MLGMYEPIVDDLAHLRRQPCDLSSLSFTHAHVLDRGGSSLALELSEKTFRGKGGLELGVLHTSDQSTLLRQSDHLCPKRALCIVATKTGVGLRRPSATIRASCTRRASSTEAIVEAASSFS